MVSIDVISLFPSILIDLAKELVTQLLLKNPLDIPSDSIMEMLNNCLNNFCKFDDEYYKQKIGLPMGSPLSGFIAEAVMQSIEAKIMAQYRPLWLRYEAKKQWCYPVFPILSYRLLPAAHEACG